MAGVERLLSMDEVAEMLGVPKRTIDNWRAVGKGPRGIVVGRWVRFRPTDVDAWLEKQADPITAA